MSEFEEPVRDDSGFEESVRGDGGEVAMPHIGTQSRGQAGAQEEQEAAEERAFADPHRVSEGYVRPGEPHTD